MVKNENDMNSYGEKLPPKQINKNLIPKAPKTCEVCERASFLKCMECDTIYCSSKCQIKDWEQHQILHAKMKQAFLQPMQNQSAKSPLQNRFSASCHQIPKQPMQTHSAKPSTIQNRLADAKNKQPITVQNVSSQLKRLDELENESNGKKQALKCKTTIATQPSLPVERPHDLNSTESLLETSLRKMIINRKFKRSVLLEENDDEGFGFVTVTAMQKAPSGCVFCWITPQILNNQRNEYKKYLNGVYEDPNIPSIPVESISKFRGHLVMAMIAGQWSRAQIINASGNIVGVEDIDSGSQTVITLPRHAIKVALEPELLKSAYAIKVLLENVENPEEEIEINNIIQVRLHSKGENRYAEVKRHDSGSSDENEICERIEKMEIGQEEDEVQVQQERIFINEMKQTDLSIGNEIKLNYLDGSKLALGKLNVCEANATNRKFLAQMFDDIQEYVKANPSSNNYKAVVRELVLAKFDDGYFYRGVCVKVSEIDMKVHFLDFGNEYVLGIQDVMRMPRQMMRTCCSQTVAIKLASSRPISDIDANETRELLMRKDKFTAKVDIIPGTTKRIITLDDSLVVFKK